MDNWAIIRMHDLEGKLRIDVAPIRDLVDHDIRREDGCLCWCHPEVTIDNGARMITHAAMDGRE